MNKNPQTKESAEVRFLVDRVEQLEKRLKRRIRPRSGKKPKIIPKGRLTSGRWYLGIGRGSNVAFWDGAQFRYFEEIMGEKTCNHWDDGAPYGCFQPFEEIDHLKYGEICAYIE